MRRMHLTLLERERDREASMALLADAMCGGRHDSCYRKHKYARASHGMGSESLSRGVDLFFAQEFCFLKQEHGAVGLRPCTLQICESSAMACCRLLADLEKWPHEPRAAWFPAEDICGGALCRACMKKKWRSGAFLLWKAP